MPYAVTVAGEGWAVVSNSPELFLDADLGAGRAASAPIKGTVARGEDAGRGCRGEAQPPRVAEGRRRARHDRRPDPERPRTGRRPGRSHGAPDADAPLVPPPPSPRVDRRGPAPPGTRPSELLRAMLPGGSITGAPKRAALGFIRRNEPVPRGAYTGVAGWVGGDGRIVLNVAIRTAILHGSRVDYHAGGGIVWDSEAGLRMAGDRNKVAGVRGRSRTPRHASEGSHRRDAGPRTCRSTPPPWSAGRASSRRSS